MTTTKAAGIADDVHAYQVVGRQTAVGELGFVIEFATRRTKNPRTGNLELVLENDSAAFLDLPKASVVLDTVKTQGMSIVLVMLLPEPGSASMDESKASSDTHEKPSAEVRQSRLLGLPSTEFQTPIIWVNSGDLACLSGHQACVHGWPIQIEALCVLQKIAEVIKPSNELYVLKSLYVPVERDAAFLSYLESLEAARERLVTEDMVFGPGAVIGYEHEDALAVAGPNTLLLRVLVMLPAEQRESIVRLGWQENVQLPKSTLTDFSSLCDPEGKWQERSHWAYCDPIPLEESRMSYLKKQFTFAVKPQFVVPYTYVIPALTDVVQASGNASTGNKQTDT